MRLRKVRKFCVFAATASTAFSPEHLPAPTLTCAKCRFEKWIGGETRLPPAAVAKVVSGDQQTEPVTNARDRAVDVMHTRG